MMRFALIALPAAALLASCGDTDGNISAPKLGAPVAAVAPPAGTEWVTTVKETAEGGMLMGNPNAPIKLVEYASLTCSHCGDFSKTAMEPLKSKYVSTGKVSYELRNYVRDPIDVTASLLARCGGPGPFFPLTEQMFADQMGWLGKIQGLGQAEYERIGTLPPAQQFARFAEVTGLGDFVRQRGVSAERANACLADKAAADRLVAMRDRANSEINLTATPTFVLNGQVVTEASNWENLEPKLRAAGA